VRVAVIGAGPAGLYLAWLLKSRGIAHQVRVFEQNPAGATYGWGVVFSDTALAFLQQTSPEVYADIATASEHWDDQVIVHRDEAVHIDGIAFSGIGRLALLEILQAHCEQVGVELFFERRIEQPPTEYDLLVGADGVNSVVRTVPFEPHVEVLTNKYVWYGTHQLFDALTLTFRHNQDGVFVAHHYRHSPTTSTFVVECDDRTWRQAGLNRMSEEDSRAYCERVFASDLRGHRLLTNRSLWMAFKVVTNRRWSVNNVVLIGDALRTVHFSIGSGTRSGLRDAVALADALGRFSSDLPRALEAFEAERRPDVDKFLSVAARSAAWYEAFRSKFSLTPVELAYDYVQRGGRISHDRLRAQSPHFTALYEAGTGRR
jgi:2-polyprenyl-6-methoxyphenol hydroxylase-like FAD-dependent oxidoreductase